MPLIKHHDYIKRELRTIQGTHEILQTSENGYRVDTAPETPALQQRPGKFSLGNSGALLRNAFVSDMLISTSVAADVGHDVCMGSDTFPQEAQL